MTIMNSSSSGEPEVKTTSSSGEPEVKAAPSSSGESAEKEKKDENVFSDENLSKKTEVDTGLPERKEIDLGNKNRKISITPEDKVAFIDSIANNSRFEKSYSLFGGKVTLTVRSLTSDEVNALAAWTVKRGTLDPSGLTTGRYRKFLAAAQVARLNGVDMPPLEDPLFETLSEDGKTTVPPGWTKRFAYWDSMSVGLFGAIMVCLADFDMLYSALCRKAEDSNFWNPDTP